jgi:GrpB-like predicted nucleotidyltransferase (UPF0157 family)
MFKREAVLIKAALGNIAVRIDHIGSTSVPGLVAKPIIDIEISVRDMEPVDRYVLPLESLGYLFVPVEDSPHLHFFGKPVERPRTHHVHVCEAGSYEERVHLAFRDYLRAHPAEALLYAELKRAVANRHLYDRLAYIAGKEPGLLEIRDRALVWTDSNLR